MVVKSKVVAEHMGDLGSVFEVFRKHKLHLNTSKCSFGIDSGKFLGYMVTHRGIEVNPDQIKAINDLQPPQNPKEMQKFTGMTTALNRFIFRSTDRCRPFFQLLHTWKGFEWNEECALAFQQLKDYLSRPPIMSRPEEEEVIFAYIVVASHAISLVLVRVENGVQRPVYYVSKSLYEVEVRYLPLEKVILAVVHATQKLPHYFQAHTIVVLTQLLLQSLLQKPDYTGRISKKGTILGAFDINYIPRTSVKGQVLVDMVAEFTESLIEVEVEEHKLEGKQVPTISLQGPLPWKLYVNGATNQRESRVELVVVSPDKITIEKSLRLGFSAMNNKAEYEALLIGIAMVQKMGGKAVEVFLDSRLIVGQVKGELEVRDLRMYGYLSQARHLQSGFEFFTTQQISRSRNAHADSLATLATSSGQDLPLVILVKDLHRLAEEKEKVQVHQIRVGPSWMDPLVLFLKEGVLSQEKGEAEKNTKEISSFLVVQGAKVVQILPL